MLIDSLNVCHSAMAMANNGTRQHKSPVAAALHAAGIYKYLVQHNCEGRWCFSNQTPSSDFLLPRCCYQSGRSFMSGAGAALAAGWAT